MNIEMSDNLTEFLDDFISTSDGSVLLEDGDFQHASELARNLTDTTVQWRVYSNVLGSIAFQKWLAERTEDMPLDVSQCTLENQIITPLFEPAAGLKLGKFRLCLIAMDSSLDDTLRVPRAVLELPDYAAHFYICISIDDDVATIQGILRHDQLVERCTSERLKMKADWAYEIPMDWLDPEIEHLLLYCRYLDPSAITQPSTPLYSAAEKAAVDRVVQALPVNVGTLSQYLSWPKGAILLSETDLLAALYRRLHPVPPLFQVVQTASDVFIDIRNLLRGQLDAVAQDFSWTVLPAPVYADALRGSGGQSVAESEEKAVRGRVLSRLNQAGIAIPSNAGHVCKYYEVSNHKLYLCIFSWLIEGQREWSLLATLTPQSEDRLPNSLRFQVYSFAQHQPSAERELVSDKIVSPADEGRYIFAQVKGNWDEHFVVSLTFKEGDRLETVPFGVGLE
jgi:hypothetical protein